MKRVFTQRKSMVKRILRKLKWPLSVLFVIFSIWYTFCLPENLFNDPTSTVLEDNKGNLMGARIAADGQWRFPMNDEVPEKFRQAIIQFEDRSFQTHFGFSFRGFGRALKQNLQEGRVVSGGSTLSMQVIRMMRKGKSRTIFEKIIEVIMATRLELAYSKAEIMSLYSSHAPFGGNVVGLDAACWRYFGRGPETLSWGEAATLAVLPNAPSLIYPGKNQQLLLEKRNRLLDRLAQVELIDSTGVGLAKLERLPGKPLPLPNLASHLLDRIDKEGRTGMRIESSLDYDLQALLARTVAVHQTKLMLNEIYNAAAIIIDIDSGRVVGYIGNSNNDSNDHGSQVDIIRAPRSSGSILKPFLYASMLQDGNLTPKMLVPDVPTKMGSYNPKNFNLSYDGAVPADRALSRSLNVPAVRMLKSYGVQKFKNKLTHMGMTTLQKSSDHYGLSLILGGAECKLWDITAMFMNMAKTLKAFPGQPQTTGEPNFINKINGMAFEPATKNRRNSNDLSPGAIWHTFQAMLEVTRPSSDINWRTFSSSNKIAWKTGTSYGFRDAWAVGVSSKYVVGIWVGNADGEGRPGLVGLEAAAPLLFDVFSALPNSDWFDPPYDDMVKARICRLSGYRATDICAEVDTAYVPVNTRSTNVCPYHKFVFFWIKKGSIGFTPTARKLII